MDSKIKTWRWKLEMEIGDGDWRFEMEIGDGDWDLRWRFEMVI